MSPFSSIEDALEFVKQSPLTGDSFELKMSDNYTLQGVPDRPMGKFSLGMAQLVMFLVQKDFEPSGSEQQQGFKIFRFSRIRMTSAAEVPFPPDFSPQRVRLKDASEISMRSPSEIVAHFKQHPEDAADLIRECADKRYMPSTFITKISGGYRVGWFSSARMHCVQTLHTREDAVTDYLLFSLGKGRWNGRTMESIAS